MLLKMLFFVYIGVTAPAFVGAQLPFAEEIEAFRKMDSMQFPPKGANLLIGSSSFTRWTDVQAYFPGYTIVNRGFGGSTLVDVIRYLPQVALQYHPGKIFIYCGENDFASSDTVTVDMVVSRFKTLFNMLRVAMPKIGIVYVSMKPSPARWQFAKKYAEGNLRIKRFLQQKKHTAFVNVVNEMLDETGKPNGKLFIADSLHMNATGYAIWKNKLIKYFIPNKK